MGLCQHRKVRAADYRLHKGGIGGKAAAILDCVLHEAHTVMLCSVHVLRSRMTEARGGLDEVVAALLFHHGIADPQRPALSAPGIATPLEMLHIAEVG